MGNYRGLIQRWSARALATIINDLINQLVRSYSVAKVADRSCNLQAILFFSLWGD